MPRATKVGHLPAVNHSRTLLLQNRQRARRLNRSLWRRIACCALEHVWPGGSYDLAIYVVGKAEITHLNERFLRHQGATDVITFDYTETPGSPALLHGEIFVCVDEAAKQARRFRTTWQSELVRYIVHGILHLLDYNDNTARARKRMKAKENELVRKLADPFTRRRFSRAR